MKFRLAVFLCAAVAGCSSETASDSAPEDKPGDLVSYEAIAGSWSGWDHTANFALSAEISEGGLAGETVGDLDVYLPSDTGLVPYCGHVLEAKSADPPLYVFDGSAGTCTPTTLTLRHDEDGQRIQLINSQGESGYLIPGSDPGPPPE